MSCFEALSEVPRNGWNKDSLGVYASPAAAQISRIVAVSIGIFHVLVVLGYSDNTFKCPHPENLNNKLFAWNSYPAACLFPIICIRAPLRHTTFAQFGSNFTFKLGPPDTLKTGGMYRYIQHHGYAGHLLSCLSTLLCFWAGTVLLGVGFLTAYSQS